MVKKLIPFLIYVIRLIVEIAIESIFKKLKRKKKKGKDSDGHNIDGNSKTGN